MSSFHHQLITTVIQQIEDSNDPISGMLLDRDPEKLIRMFFSNYRAGSDQPRGLRLTNTGLMLMKSAFHSYHVKLNSGYLIKANHLIWLDRNLKYPYHLSADHMVLFDSDIAFDLKMCDGDLQRLITMKDYDKNHGDRRPLRKKS